MKETKVQFCFKLLICGIRMGEVECNLLERRFVIM